MTVEKFLEHLREVHVFLVFYVHCRAAYKGKFIRTELDLENQIFFYHRIIC